MLISLYRHTRTENGQPLQISDEDKARERQRDLDLLPRVRETRAPPGLFPAKRRVPLQYRPIPAQTRRTERSGPGNTLPRQIDPKAASHSPGSACSQPSSVGKMVRF